MPRRQLRLHDLPRCGEEGQELLNKMDDKVADRLDMGADLQLNSRLGCQTVIQKPGDVVIEIPPGNATCFRGWRLNKWVEYRFSGAVDQPAKELGFSRWGKYPRH